MYFSVFSELHLILSVLIQGLVAELTILMKQLLNSVNIASKYIFRIVVVRYLFISSLPQFSSSVLFLSPLPQFSSSLLFLSPLPQSCSSVLFLSPLPQSSSSVLFLSSLPQSSSSVLFLNILHPCYTTASWTKLYFGNKRGWQYIEGEIYLQYKLHCTMLHLFDDL